MKKKKKLKSVASLKKKLDTVFSRYIRLRDANDMGFCTCISCGKVDEWKSMHCGHFLSRRYNAIRFDERNAHAQCPACNLFLSGNAAEYLVALEKRYGREVVDELMQMKYQSKRFTRPELEEMIQFYKDANAKSQV